MAPALDATGRRALWGALVPLLVVLVQAGVCWLLARGWVLRSGMPSALACPPTGWLREVRRWRTPRLVKDMRTQTTA